MSESDCGFVTDVQNILFILKGWRFALEDDALARTVKVAYFNKFVLAQVIGC